MIVSIVFLALAALFVFLGVLKGRKYTWLFSALRIIGIALSAVLSMLLSVLAARLLGGLLIGLVGKLPLGDAKDFLEELPTVTLAVKMLIAVLLAPILFWGAFPILYNVLSGPIKAICRGLVKCLPQRVTDVSAPATDNAVADEKKKKQKKQTKKQKKLALRVAGKNPVGMLLGGVCGLLLFCVALVPIVGMTTTAHRVVTAAQAAFGEDVIPTKVVEVLDLSVNNVGSVMVRGIGGDALYRGMTTYRVDGEKISLANEIGAVDAIAVAATDGFDKETPPAEAAAAIRGIEPALKESVLLPRIGAELVGSAAHKWVADESYHGIGMPTLKGYEKTVKAIVGTQENATPDTFCEDVGTIVHMLAYLAEQDAFGEGSDEAELFGNEELTEHLLYELLNNPRLYVTVGSAFDIGLKNLSENLNMEKTKANLYEHLCADLATAERLPEDATEDDVKRVKDGYRKVMESYGIHADLEVYARAAEASVMETTDMAAWFAAEGVVSADTMLEKCELVTAEDITVEPIRVQNTAAEAKHLAHALATILDVAEHAEAHDMDVSELIIKLGPALDDLGATETLGHEKSEKIFKATLQSQKVSDQIGLSVLEASDAADSINENSRKTNYSIQMVSLSQTIKIFRDAGSEESEQAIGELIQDLTPESASTIQTIATPSVMLNHGVPERSAEPVADMVFNMFGNLSDVKAENGMTEEEVEKETAAVNKVINLTMKAGQSDGTVFGEDSITGESAEQFVDDIMNSSVASKTLMDEVYGDGEEPITDPLLTNRQMQEEEEAQLLEALNNKWNNSTEEQKADETYQKKIVAIAALVNVSVSIGEDGVTKVA